MPQLRNTTLILLSLTMGLACQRHTAQKESPEVDASESRNTTVRYVNDFDRDSLDSKLSAFPNRRPSLEEIALSFIGTPYEAGTLEIEGEPLVVNLGAFDCTTYVENVLALDMVLNSSEPRDSERFVPALEQLRYRGGIRNGYASRLHYFSEWLHDNADKGLITEMTEGLGGHCIDKPLDFMGKHREAYPALASESEFRAVKAMEKRLANRPICVLPTERIREVEDRLRSGDIVAIATDIEGLDVTHTGFALRRPNGRIHLLHASTQGTVRISDRPLEEYVHRGKRNVGILVARPVRKVAD